MSLKGSIHDMPLNDLFEVFHISRKSGILHLFGSTQSASLYVTMGRVIDAVLVQGPQQQIVAVGDEAILQIFTWEQAEFIFSPDKTVMYRPVTVFQDTIKLAQLEPAFCKKTINAFSAPILSPIKVDCAFAQDLSVSAPAPAHHDNQYRRMSLASTRIIASAPQQKRLDLLPCYEEERMVGSSQVQIVPVSMPETTVIPTKPIAAAAAAPATTTAPQPSRRLMQAILRRVRSL